MMEHEARALEPLRLPRRMAPTDALFWLAESALPSFRPIIAGLYLLDRRPDPARLEAGLDAAVARVPRLRQRVVEAPLPLGLPEWLDDPHYDRDYHLRHVALPEPGTFRALLDLAAALLATPLDRERPLWEAYWIEGLEGDRAALFLKLHHSVVDGVGSLAIMDALTQRRAEDPVVRVTLPRARARRATGHGLAALAFDAAAGSARAAWRAAGAPARWLAHPVEASLEAGRTLRGLRGIASDLARPAVRDPLAAGSSGLSRRLDVTEVSLERLRKIKAPLGVTINDVVLAALSATLGSYHRERGIEVDSLNCLVPMNLRARDERDRLGNRVGMCTIALPISEAGPRRQLERIAAQTRRAKSDRRGAAIPFLLEALPLVPVPALRWIGQRSLGRVNVACTNIPGVDSPRWMAGARVEAIYPFASVVEGTPLVMALLSYAGRVDIGIDTDPEAIPDTERVRALFAASLDDLESLARG